MKKQIVNRELLSLLPNEVKEMNLPPKANEIYCQFLSMADDGWYYSTIEGLAKTLNCSKTTVTVNLKLLENKNLIIERVNGKIGVASRFRIKLFNSTNNSTECSTNSTEYNNSTNNSTECSTELKTFIEEVITLKINELKNDIILELKNGILNELRCMFNVNSTIKENKIKEYKIKQINNNSYTNSSNNIQEINNTDIDNNLNNIENIEINKKEDINKEIDLNINESIDKSTCKYKRRKQNDYQFTLEDENDYNPIVENTKVEGVVSKSDGNTSKSKKSFYYLKGSTSKFSSWEEAQKHARENNLNFDECFKKVEVLA